MREEWLKVLLNCKALMMMMMINRLIVACQLHRPASLLQTWRRTRPITTKEMRMLLKLMPLGHHAWCEGARGREGVRAR